MPSLRLTTMKTKENFSTLADDIGTSITTLPDLAHNAGNPTDCWSRAAPATYDELDLRLMQTFPASDAIARY